MAFRDVSMTSLRGIGDVTHDIDDAILYVMTMLSSRA